MLINKCPFLICHISSRFQEEANQELPSLNFHLDLDRIRWHCQWQDHFWHMNKIQLCLPTQTSMLKAKTEIRIAVRWQRSDDSWKLLAHKSIWLVYHITQSQLRNYSGQWRFCSLMCTCSVFTSWSSSIVWGLAAKQEPFPQIKTQTNKKHVLLVPEPNTKQNRDMTRKGMTSECYDAKFRVGLLCFYVMLVLLLIARMILLVEMVTLYIFTITKN